MDDNKPIKVMDIMGFKTKLFGRTVHVYERSMVERWLVEKDAEIERLRRELAEARGALQELRIRLHAAGRRPEECYEMSVIDTALAADQPDAVKPCADCGEPTDVWHDGTHLCWKCRA
jgi:hypothetical protein